MSAEDERFARLQRFVGGEPHWERVGRYRLFEMLGEGGAGIVFRARDENLARDVAIKILKTAQVFSGTQVERFLREARNAARLRHPAIAAVYETGRDEDVLFYAMELVEGRPFDPRQGSLRERTAILAKAARAVHYAHEEGILHRDLKPGNILVDSEGMPRILDFGLSRDAAGPDGLTQTGAIFGTPAYMAPEQAEGRGHQASATADVYSLGTLLYEALAGRVPFEGGSMQEVIHRLLTEEPQRPDGPEDLASIALKAMEKDPARRYASAAAFADDLERFLAGEPTLARPPSVSDRIRRHAVRRWRVWVGLVLVLTIAALVVHRRPGEEDGKILEGTVARIDGEVFVVEEKGRSPAKVGTRLATGQALQAGSGSTATVTYPDGTRLDLGPQTAIRQGRASVGTAYSRVSSQVVLLSGSLSAGVSLQSEKEPFYISTLHAAAYLTEGKYAIEGASAWTRVDAVIGTARVVPLRGGPVASAAAGQYAVVESGGDVVVRKVEDSLVSPDLPRAFDNLTRGITVFLVIRPTAAAAETLLQLGKVGEDTLALSRESSGELRYTVLGERIVRIPAVFEENEVQRISLVHHPTGAVFVRRNGIAWGSGFAVLPPRPATRTEKTVHPGLQSIQIYDRALSDAECASIDRSLAARYGGIALAGGWTGEYFNGTTLSVHRFTRRDAELSFDWGPESPDPTVDADRFSVRWTGRLVPLYSEPTTFHVVADDGVRLWVDGRLVVNSWIDQVPTEFTATVALVAGQPCDLRMEFYEHASSAQAKLFWSGSSTPRSPIPTGRLSPTPVGASK